MTVVLKDIDRQNWEEAIGLAVAPEQKHFVASNVYSIAESKFDPALVPLAIYADGLMVGFTMYGVDTSTGEHWIIRLMVDRRFQGRGYGRAAMAEVIQRLQARPDCREIFVSYEPDNDVAATLYRSLGFEDTGRVVGRELVMRLSVVRPDDETPLDMV